MTAAPHLPSPAPCTDPQLCIYFLVRLVCAASDSARDVLADRDRAQYADDVSASGYARACERGYARGY